MRVRTFDELRGSPDAELIAPAIERARSMRDLFAGDAPLYAARAPGRLDVMGGIADYSGSLVLQLPLAVATTAVLQGHDAPTLEIVSLRAREAVRFTMPLGDLFNAGRDPVRLREWFAAHRRHRWAAYVAGVASACLVGRGVAGQRASRGFRLLIESSVPEGKGVSSSAALEVSCLAVIAAHYGVEMSGEEIATASQWAENHVAGAPCGIMDQMTSACGRRDRLLRLRCQPGIVEGHVAIPSGYRFYGIDSGIRHAVTGADYGTVRTAAFMGYRIIAAAEGLRAGLDASTVRDGDERWHGYLANLAPSDFEARYRARLPESMTGGEFLERYGGITDDATRVDAERTYPVRQATAHPVHENARVARFAELLAGLTDGGEEAARAMGALMYESHASYGACGLGSDGTDRLVELVRESGPERGVFGAKITGGGSGGTVAVLGTDAAEPVVREIAERYERETGRRTTLFMRSGPGAEEIGVVTA